MKILIILSVCIGLAVNCMAQTDFTGRWKIKELQHLTGPKYGNALQKEMAVAIKNDSLIVDAVIPGRGSDTKSRQAYSLDGKPFSYKNRASSRKIVKSYAISKDQKAITLKTFFYLENNDNEVDFTRFETWTIENGKLVVNKKSIETRSETWEVRGVFEKAG